MAQTYTTIQGDTWDLIAWRLFGEEKYMKHLMEANRAHVDTLVFSPGIALNVPELPEEAGEDVPFWRSPANSAGGATYSPTTEADDG